MNRVARIVSLAIVAILGLFAVRYFLTGAHVGGGTAARSVGFAQADITPVLHKASGGRIAAERMGVIVAGTLIYALMVGHAARLLLGDRAFGPRINGLIALLGSWLALLGLGVLTGHGSANAIGLAMGLAMLGSVLAVVGAVAAKAFLAGELDALLNGRRTRTEAVVARIDKIAMPRGPSKDRLRAAVSRANR